MATAESLFVRREISVIKPAATLLAVYSFLLTAEFKILVIYFVVEGQI
jgi:hypothetical protein